MDILQVIYYFCDFVCKGDSLINSVKDVVKVVTSLIVK